MTVHHSEWKDFYTGEKADFEDYCMDALGWDLTLFDKDYDGKYLSEVATKSWEAWESAWGHGFDSGYEASEEDAAALKSQGDTDAELF